jgi:hypothetical protein
VAQKLQLVFRFSCHNSLVRVLRLGIQKRALTIAESVVIPIIDF